MRKGEEGRSRTTKRTQDKKRGGLKKKTGVTFAERPGTTTITGPRPAAPDVGRPELNPKPYLNPKF